MSFFADWAGIVSFAWAVLSTIGNALQLRAARRKEQGLLAALNASEAQLGRVQAELADRARYDPRTWPARAPGQASDLLRSFEDAAPELAQAAGRIAAAHASEMAPVQDHATALRFARLQALLQSPDLPLPEQLTELEAIHALEQAGAGTYVPDAALLSASRDDQVDAALLQGYIAWLITAARPQAIEAPQLFELLMRRARRLAQRRLGDRHRLTLIARQLWAEAVGRLGQTEQALQDLDDILPLVKAEFGPSDQRVLDILMAQQGFLHQQGDFDRAAAMDHRIMRLAERIDRIGPTPEQEAEAREDLQRAMDFVLRRAKQTGDRGPEQGS